VERPDGGFAVSLPSAWTVLDLSGTDVNALADQVHKELPNLPDAVLQQFLTLARQGAVFFAVDPTTFDNGFVTNVNVVKVPSVGTGTTDLLSGLVRSQLQSLGATVLDTAAVKLGGAPALRVTYLLPVGGSTLNGTQYYITGPKAAYVLTYSSRDPDRTLADAIAAGFVVH